MLDFAWSFWLSGDIDMKAWIDEYGLIVLAGIVTLILMEVIGETLLGDSLSQLIQAKANSIFL